MMMAMDIVSGAGRPRYLSASRTVAPVRRSVSSTASDADLRDAVAKRHGVAFLDQEQLSRARDDRGANGSVGARIFGEAVERERRRTRRQRGRRRASASADREAARAADAAGAGALNANRFRPGASGAIVGLQARSCSRATSASSAAPRASTADVDGRRRRRDVVPHRGRRRRPATRPARRRATPIVATRLMFIGVDSDRSTRSSWLCYYSSCTLHRLVLRSIESLRCRSSPSSPPDSPLPRLPGKPLADIDGRPMIEHVYRRAAARAVVARVIVATDDQRIADARRALRRRGAADARAITRAAPIGSPRSPRRSTATSSSTCRATSR